MDPVAHAPKDIKRNVGVLNERLLIGSRHLAVMIEILSESTICPDVAEIQRHNKQPIAMHSHNYTLTHLFVSSRVHLSWVSLTPFCQIVALSFALAKKMKKNVDMDDIYSTLATCLCA
jgi:hypothetical protein